MLRYRIFCVLRWHDMTTKSCAFSRDWAVDHKNYAFPPNLWEPSSSVPGDGYPFRWRIFKFDWLFSFCSFPFVSSIGSTRRSRTIEKKIPHLGLDINRRWKRRNDWIYKEDYVKKQICYSFPKHFPIDILTVQKLFPIHQKSLSWGQASVDNKSAQDRKKLL